MWHSELTFLFILFKTLTFEHIISIQVFDTVVWWWQTTGTISDNTREQCFSPMYIIIYDNIHIKSLDESDGALSKTRCTCLCQGSLIVFLRVEGAVATVNTCGLFAVFMHFYVIASSSCSCQHLQFCSTPCGKIFFNRNLSIFITTACYKMNLKS